MENTNLHEAYLNKCIQDVIKYLNKDEKIIFALHDINNNCDNCDKNYKCELCVTYKYIHKIFISHFKNKIKNLMKNVINQIKSTKIFLNIVYSKGTTNKIITLFNKIV